MKFTNELQTPRNADRGTVLPGIDTEVGNPLSASSLIVATTLHQSDIYYDPTHNSVIVKRRAPS